MHGEKLSKEITIAFYKRRCRTSQIQYFIYTGMFIYYLWPYISLYRKAKPPSIKISLQKLFKEKLISIFLLYRIFDK